MPLRLPSRLVVTSPPHATRAVQTPTSFAFLWAEITRKLLAADAHSHVHPQHPEKLAPGYGSNIPSGRITKIIQTLTPNSAKTPIKRFQSVSIMCMARFFHLLCGHAPIGRYHQKMRSKHEQPYACPCGINPPEGDGFEAGFTTTIQTREHILYQCPLYYHKPVFVENGLPIYPQYLDEFNPFPKIHTFLLDNPWAFMFEEVPESNRLAQRYTDFWMTAGGRLWDMLCSKPENFLCPLPKEQLPTIAHAEDHIGFIRTFYRDICLFKKWAVTAYNEHVQALVARTALTQYKRFLSTCGLLDDMAEPDDDKSHAPTRV